MSIWASQMEDVPMEIQTSHGHTSHWAMKDHCLEGQGWDGATQSIPYMNGVVKLSRLQKTFWAFQMGDDPMTLQIPYGHSCHWGMGGHCLEARARVGLRISEYPWCEMVWSKYYTSRKRFEHYQWEMTLWHSRYQIKLSLLSYRWSLSGKETVG